MEFFFLKYLFLVSKTKSNCYLRPMCGQTLATHEDFFGFYNIPDIGAETIKLLLKLLPFWTGKKIWTGKKKTGQVKKFSTDKRILDR